MDDPYVALLFAEDLVQTILFHSGLTRPTQHIIIPLREKIQNSRLTVEIIEAVIAIIGDQRDKIMDSFKQLLKKGVKEMFAFRIEVCITTVYNFPNGYCPARFLNLCALLVGLSFLYAKEGNFEIADASAQVLGYVLNFFIYMLKFDPQNSWSELSYEAQRTKRLILDKQSRL